MTVSFLSAGREGLGVEGVLTHVASVHSLSSEVVTEEAQMVLIFNKTMPSRPHFWLSCVSSPTQTNFTDFKAVLAKAVVLALGTVVLVRGLCWLASWSCY